MKKARAFTVVEVLLVVVVMAILSAVVIPRMTGTRLYSGYLIYTTAHRIAADMRLTRRLAITTGDRHRLRCFQTGGSRDYNEYRIQRRIGGSWVLVGEVKYIPDEIIASGTQTVRFNADGSANSNCTFRYRIGSVRYRVTVRQTTGRVKLEAY